MSSISKEAKLDENGNIVKPDEPEIKSGVDQLITKDRVVIFSKSTCPHCDNAKKVFETIGQPYATVELTTHPKAPELQTVLQEMTGAGTVPRVFVDGVCIGGGTDTVQMYKEGRLEQILRQQSEDAANSGNESHGESQEKFN